MAVRLRAQLRASRKRAGLTQTALGKRLHRTQAWVYRVEAGERKLEVTEFIAIAEAIGLNPGEFLNAILREAPLTNTVPQCNTEHQQTPASPTKPST